MGENSTASYYGSTNYDAKRDKKQQSNHSMTTLSEKNEDLEALRVVDQIHERNLKTL